MMLRRIFGSKMVEVMGKWRKFHSGVIRNLYTSPNVIKQIKPIRMRWAGHVAHIGEERKVYYVLVGKLGGEKPLGRLRHAWEDGIKMDLTEIGWKVVEFIHPAQYRDWWQAVVNTVMNPRVLAPQS
jgi:hypothetical protein